MPRLGPRLVIAGTHSGVGKTTVATGLMAALRARGRRVASAKVGPDFIDPSYHRVATGRAGRSLDVWLSGTALIGPLAAAGAAGTDLLVVEGVMGLFDGSGQEGCDGSTAEVARLLDAPVVLVVDASALSGSVAALVHGFHTLDPRLRLAGVILNRVGGPGHATLLREALAPIGVPVLGVVTEDDGLLWRERHLGLVPVAESPGAVAGNVERLGARIEQCCDVAALVALAESAPGVGVGRPPGARPVGRARVAVAGGAAFSFMYPENLELLGEAGAEMVTVDPLTDASLPAGCTGLFAGGGFPEAFAPALGANRPLLTQVRAAVGAGLVTWAECGGLLWLSQAIDGTAMAGVVPGEATMEAPLTIGYRTAVTRVPSPLGGEGTELRGHEFHQSVLTPPGDALDVVGRFGSGRMGYAGPTLFASYLHQHLSARPELAERFVRAAAAAGGSSPAAG